MCGWGGAARRRCGKHTTTKNSRTAQSHQAAAPQSARSSTGSTPAPHRPLTTRRRSRAAPPGIRLPVPLLNRSPAPPPCRPRPTAAAGSPPASRSARAGGAGAAMWLQGWGGGGAVCEGKRLLSVLADSVRYTHHVTTEGRCSFSMTH